MMDASRRAEMLEALTSLLGITNSEIIKKRPAMLASLVSLYPEFQSEIEAAAKRYGLSLPSPEPPEQDSYTSLLIAAQRFNLSVDMSNTESVVDCPKSSISIDPELTRIASGLGSNIFNLLRVWVYAREHATQSGWIHRDDLAEKLDEFNVTSCARTLRGWLTAGKGLFWRFDRNTSRIYPRAYANPKHPQNGLGAMLVQKAIEAGMPELVDTNRPGARPVLINLAGKASDAMARCFAAWVNGKTINRDDLGKLWKRTTRTLQLWTQSANITVAENYGQYAITKINKIEDVEHFEDIRPIIPNYAYKCRAKDGTLFYSWRLPNTYTISNDEHLPRGRARKARKAANLSYAQTNLPVDKRSDGLQPIGRVYFTDRQTKRGKRDSFQCRSAHTRKDNDVNLRQHYASLRKTRRGINIYEGGKADVPTTAHLKRDFAAERTPEFQALRTADRIWRGV